MFSKGVIAKAEFEKIKLDYDLAENALYQFKKQRINTWQAVSTDLDKKINELQSDSTQLSNSKESFTITAPINGTLINVVGLEEGSFITAGSVLAEITPDTDLIAECYLSPSEIGLINSEKVVKFQIDAFNYNQWGMV